MTDAVPTGERPDRVPYRTIREWAGDERPRERLLEHGPGVLADAELLAILLRTGRKGENVVDLARRLLETLGGLRGLVRADAASLQTVDGLGPAKAAELAAALELGRRVHAIDPGEQPPLLRPEAVFALLGPRLLGKTREEFYALPLDTKGRLLGGVAPVSGGSVSAVTIRPAETFRQAIMLEATSVILAHNHPSGDPRPSAQDVEVTRELIAAGELLDIEVLDHVVIGAKGFVSLRREGLAFRA
ncbi:RadC family protein [Tepidiforma sp.]|uniref:RadC family protein n=1 Tax=Tepidiforma sp. TaxID=2682230 RepID=UPI002ADD55F2|nr:DNA repair protein RadC [Tepidiforma sp.]